MNIGIPISRVAALAGFAAMLMAGCSQGPAAADLPSVDGKAAAESAMQQYDKNSDSVLDAAEIASFPPLAAARASFDVDGNNQLSPEEIEGRVSGLYGPSAALTGLDSIVTLDGRPLRGATIKFQPVEMLGESVQMAQGVTDESGVARMGVDDENLPNDLQGERLVQPGLFRVEITHPTVALPARYNTASELGYEVDPGRRESSAQFNLRSK